MDLFWLVTVFPFFMLGSYYLFAYLGRGHLETWAETAGYNIVESTLILAERSLPRSDHRLVYEIRVSPLDKPEEIRTGIAFVGDVFWGIFSSEVVVEWQDKKNPPRT
jgi:hypothetical protein